MKVSGTIISLLLLLSAPSGGRSSLRSMKVTPLTHRPDGSIVTIDGGKE